MTDVKRIVLVILAIVLLLWCGFGIRGKINESGEKNARLHNTAIQVQDADHFNYAVDSRQGIILGYGEFGVNEPVKFDEMGKSFAAVQKVKEEYTMHTETYECGTSEAPRTCTRTYYSWDYAGSEMRIASNFTLHGRQYPGLLFDLGVFLRRVDACDFTRADTSGWLQSKNGCRGGYFYTSNDDRYYYKVADQKFKAGFIANVSDGSLKPLKGTTIDLQSKTVKQMVADANNYTLPGNIFITLWFLFVLGGGAALAYFWAKETIT